MLPAPLKKQHNLVPLRSNDVQVIPARKMPVQTRPVSQPLQGQVVHSRAVTIAVAQEKQEIDSETLMRMIRLVTQSIGEYKRDDTEYGNRYIIPALRQARSRMITDLEVFGIHWKIDDNGQCLFYR